jgi:hypothetical protein
MSHTTAINCIKITDISALRSAITELKSHGVKCDLLENAVPRAYYPNQEGLGKAEFVVNVKDARYDVGLYKDKEGVGYEARCDFYTGSIEDVLGAKAQKGEDIEMARLGKLYQTYAIHAATNAAVQQGYSVQRINQEGGTVQLQVTGV